MLPYVPIFLLAIIEGEIYYIAMCVAATLGLSLSQTVEGFLRFRAPFHHELAVAARRRGFDAAETTEPRGPKEGAR